MRVLFDLRTPAILGAFKNARLVFITAAIDRYTRAFEGQDQPFAEDEVRQALHRTMWELMGFIRDDILIYRVDPAGTLCVEDAVIDHFKPAYDAFYGSISDALRYAGDDEIDDIVEIMDEFFSVLYDVTEQELTMVGNFLCEFT